MDKKEIVLLANSDYGRPNGIGFRLSKIAPVLDQLSIPYIVYGRNRGRFKNYRQIFPALDFISKSMKAVGTKFSTNMNYGWVEYKILNQIVPTIRQRHQNGIIHGFGILNEVNLDVFDMPMAHDYYSRTQRGEKGLLNIVGSGELQLQNNLEKASLIIAPSRFVVESLLMAGIDEKKVRLIPFGADSVPSMSERFIQSRLESVEKYIYLFAGNVCTRKGITYLLKAWQKLSPKNAELWLVGRVYKDIEKELNQAMIVTDTIKAFGFKKDVRSYFKQAHVYVFPSLLEGSSKSIYEAMANGLPVITTPNAGSIVTDSEDGYIVPIANVDQLVTRLECYLEHPQSILKHGRQALKNVSPYTWDRYGRSVVKVYRELL